MTWFWSTPEWADYCRAFGAAGPIDNYRPTNIVIPLGLLDRMLENMRPTTRARIRQADTLDASWSGDRASFDQYQYLHEKAAGRKTRPQRTFDLMYEWIGRGYAELLSVYAMDFALSMDGALVGASLWITYQGGVYYASSAREPMGQRGRSIGHFMVWSAMQHFAAKYYRWLDLGFGHIEPTEDDADRKKQAAIIEFKRGFVRHP